VNPDNIVRESKEIAETYHMYSTGLEVSFLLGALYNNKSNFDLTTISSALQYIENWEDALEVAFTNSKYVLLMRTPLIKSDQHLEFVQTPGQGLYADTNSSWPIRLFSREKFMSNLGKMSEPVFSTYDPKKTFLFDGGIFPPETFLLKSKLKT